MKKDKNLYLLTGDLGYPFFNELEKEFPKRFINCGLAEQNMISFAAGLALSGKKVFLYSIIPFAIMRDFEQIRNDLCYQNLDVKIIGDGAGLVYGSLGPTHHAICDVGIMRNLPNMKVLAPVDARETELLVEEAYKMRGPAYLRIERKKDPKIFPEGKKAEIGRGVILEEGDDVAIFGYGTILENALLVAENLRKKGISVRVVDMSSLKPLDEEIILETARKAKAIFILEEHNIIGGLGEAASFVLSSNRLNIPFKAFAIPDTFSHFVGDQKYLREKYKLDPENLEKEILKFLRM